MVQPQIDGLEILGLVGEGSCGSVFIARDAQGEWKAVRVFNAIAINRPLIEGIVKRLHNGSYPTGCVEAIWVESHQGSRCLVMPMLAEVDEAQGTIKPRSLQETTNGYPVKDAWDIVDKIAHAIASMHQRRIPHGNLKPGNIFFDTDGNAKLTDFAMGHMPGVGMLPYSDALLYAPPEQLREPEGYSSGRGYAWDTYAFAVLAFRMLTGKFPRCEATFSKVAPGPGESHVTGINADVTRLAERLEHRELENWPEETNDPRERKRREVIQRCLSLNPEDRCKDLSEVISEWQLIDTDAKAADDSARQNRKLKLTKAGMFTALGLATAGGIGCLILSGLLSVEKTNHSSDVAELNNEIVTLTERRDQAITAETSAKQKQQTAELRETKMRNQLIALGVTNDHLLAWLIKDRNKDLPELLDTEDAYTVMSRDLRKFLKITEGEMQFQAIRSRVTLQLAELELHAKNTAAADQLLDAFAKAPAQTTANNKTVPLPYRIARARLIVLLQALDGKNQPLINRALPKARTAIAAVATSKTANPTEQKRINAVMQIIDGQIIQNKEPAKALEHFQLAIKDLSGIRDALPANVSVRSDLARYSLLSYSLADTLGRIDDATRLRGEAADHLRWLLEKNPKHQLAKTRLANFELLAAEADMRSGRDASAAKKLSAAEKLLAGLTATDTLADGAAMQIAVAKGLRAITYRDRGRVTDAAKQLDEAINIITKIVAANPTATEPLYRLAALHWQRAGIAGDAGDVETEISLGTRSATMMQKLLTLGAGKRDTELRRSLAYLYGDLGHTATTLGKRNQANTFYKSAAKTWQELINKHGQQSEYLEGLKWCKSHQTSR